MDNKRNVKITDTQSDAAYFSELVATRHTLPVWAVVVNTMSGDKSMLYSYLS